MIITERISERTLPTTIHQFPFDVIKMEGGESIDFLQRITTNDFSTFSKNHIQKTLLINDKGRILDAAWIILHNNHVLMFISEGMASTIIPWLNKYIIMEEIALSDVSSEVKIDIHTDQQNDFYHTDYFGFPVSFEIKTTTAFTTADSKQSLMEIFEPWRIENGIPSSMKEIVQEYNPLELNLWDWISFTKGCYIGQEVIARLDTYNKIQRCLCKISSDAPIIEQNILLDREGTEAGKITSVAQKNGRFIGLAVVRTKHAIEQQQLITKDSKVEILIDRVFKKELYGRN